MINLYSRVRIRPTGIVGTLVDVFEASSGTVCLVESSKKEMAPEGYMEYPIYDCKIEDLEIVDKYKEQ